MRSRNPKRVPLIGFVAGAAVLALAGTAFACTEYRGKVTINGPGNVTATYRGTGEDQTGATHGYCENPTRVEFKTADTLTMNFSLAVERVTDCPIPPAINHVASPDGAHEVRWIKATDAIDHGTNCHFTPSATNPWVLLGAMNVADNPSGPDGSGSYALPATMRGNGNICVTPATSGQIAPPMIFMKWTVV